MSVLEGAGGELAAAITAACMALADAGIALYDLAPCCTVVSPCVRVRSIDLDGGSIA